ncbi:TPA: signal peptidase [Clostridioides difficile]|nr:signal peptidase [Clostridioides difficile]
MHNIREFNTIKCFILTKWYVKDGKMGDTFFGLTGFILTKWYVKLLILTTFSAVACFILTKWYVKKTVSTFLVPSNSVLY